MPCLKVDARDLERAQLKKAGGNHQRQKESHDGG